MCWNSCRTLTALLLGVLLGVAAGPAWAQNQKINGGLTLVGAVNRCVSAAGTDTYACALDPAVTSYQSGTFYTFRADVANTGAATINFNGVGAKTIKKGNGSNYTTDLATNDICATQEVTVMYDGTNMQIHSPTCTAASSGGSTTLTYATGTDANTTMAVNTVYLTNMSAWATADRTYTLPTSCTVGDVIGVIVTAGNATTFELVLTAGTSDTLNGIAGGTEWSRLFITNEKVMLRCVVVDSVWTVEVDGRIAQKGIMRLSTDADGESAATPTRPTQASTPGAWTADIDVGNVCGVTTDRLTARRAGQYLIGGIYTSKDTITATQYGGFYVTKNDTSTLVVAPLGYPAGVPQVRATSTALVSLAATDFLLFQYISQAGNLGAVSNTYNATAFFLTEQLP
jgi:hypothetical protein